MSRIAAFCEPQAMLLSDCDMGQRDTCTVGTQPEAGREGGGGGEGCLAVTLRQPTNDMYDHERRNQPNGLYRRNSGSDRATVAPAVV